LIDKNAIRPHTLLAKIFHWGFILVFIYALTKQLAAVEELNDTALLRFEIIFAALFLLLLAVRYIYMRRTQPTALPETTSRTMKLMARAGHLGMYISLAMIAISGLIIGALFSIGGSEAPGMDAAIGLHEISVVATYGTIALHVAAAFYHRLKGDGIWSSMVPVWKEKAEVE